jgi:hypothetical protein
MRRGQAGMREQESSRGILDEPAARDPNQGRLISKKTNKVHTARPALHAGGSQKFSGDKTDSEKKNPN